MHHNLPLLCPTLPFCHWSSSTVDVYFPLVCYGTVYRWGHGRPPTFLLVPFASPELTAL